MLVYLAADEFRHLWQFEHEAKLNQICKLLEIDDEDEADIFVLRTLSQYRQNPQAFVHAVGIIDEDKQHPISSNAL